MEEALDSRTDVGVNDRRLLGHDHNGGHEHGNEENERANRAGVFQISEHWVCPPSLRSLGWDRGLLEAWEDLSSPPTLKLSKYCSSNNLAVVPLWSPVVGFP